VAADKKKAARLGAVIAFFDETGLSYDAPAATTWAPRGRTPVLERTSRRRELSTLAALTTTFKLYKVTVPGAADSADVIRAVRHVRRCVGAPLLVIWDRLNVHRSKAVRAWLDGQADVWAEFLPPYAPDLNPEEQCNGNVKAHLRNNAPHTNDQLRHEADRQWARLQHSPRKLRNFFLHARLRV
jgi:transposase